MIQFYFTFQYEPPQELKDIMRGLILIHQDDSVDGVERLSASEKVMEKFHVQTLKSFKPKVYEKDTKQANNSMLLSQGATSTDLDRAEEIKNAYGAELESIFRGAQFPCTCIRTTYESDGKVKLLLKCTFVSTSNKFIQNHLKLHYKDAQNPNFAPQIMCKYCTFVSTRNSVNTHMQNDHAGLSTEEKDLLMEVATAPLFNEKIFDNLRNDNQNIVKQGLAMQKQFEEKNFTHKWFKPRHRNGNVSVASKVSIAKYQAAQKKLISDVNKINQSMKKPTKKPKKPKK